MQVACPAGASTGLPALRWAAPQSAPAPHGPLQLSWLRQRRRPAAPDLACRTIEQGRLQGGLLAFQPSSQGAAQEVGGGMLSNGTARVSLPNEAFQQLRQAVLTSLDIADNTELTVDYEDGGGELQDDILLDCPSYKEVGKSVFEALRIDQAGKSRRVYVRRRDLIRAHGLQPRDLRRVDPSLSPTKVSPSVTIKEGCALLNIGGVRAVVTDDKCLLFEPNSPSSRKFLEIVMPKIQSAAANARRAAMRGQRGGGGGSSDDGLSSLGSGSGGSMSDVMEGDYYGGNNEHGFEDDRIFPFELEMLEGALMVATGKLDTELVAATRRVSSMLQKLPREITPVNLEELRRVKQLLVELESKSENMRDLLEELMDDEEEFIQLNLSSRPKREEKRKQRERERLEREMADRSVRVPDGAPTNEPKSGGFMQTRAAAEGHSGAGDGRKERIAKLKQRVGDNKERGDEDDSGYQDAQDALEEMIEEEEEERELEEVEDLLEYYLQRAANTQSEAERLLAGARDLEESIGVSLSARRFEVNRLELMLSIASFAAALGAMVAGIFGMNLRSTLEMSVVGFWGTTAMIVLGCYWVFWILYRYTKRKRIL